MVLEVGGISLLMPMIDLLINPESKGDFPLWHAFLSCAGDESNILLLGLAFVVLFFALKNIFLAFQVNLHSKYSFGVQVETSTYLFDDYLARPYKFFLKTNTAELLRNVVGEVNSFVGYVLQPILVIITECLVLCAIITLLLFDEPQASLLALVFVGGLGWAFHRVTKQRILEWGKERQRREGMKIKCLQEGFTGIKAHKLLDDHAFLSESFREHTQLGAVAGRKQYAMKQMPRLLLETFRKSPGNFPGLPCRQVSWKTFQKLFLETVPEVSWKLSRLMPRSPADSRTAARPGRQMRSRQHHRSLLLRLPRHPLLRLPLRLRRHRHLHLRPTETAGGGPCEPRTGLSSPTSCRPNS